MGKVKIIKASAGSGKTYRLALEYIVRVLQEPTLYRHILAVTFTNKATEEMKQRILDYINELAHGEENSFMKNVLLRSGLSRSLVQERAAEVLNLILHDYDSFAVLTIDKFFQRIIRSFVRELGIDINYNLELKTDTLLDLGADRLIEDLATDKDLRQWTFDYINENITEGKPYNLKESITSLGKQLFSESYRAVQTGDNPRLSLAALNKAAHAEAATCRKRQVELAEEIISNLSSQGVTLDMLHYGSRGVGGYLAKAIGGEQPTTNSYILATLSEGKWLATSHAKKIAIGDTATLGDRLARLIEAVRATTIAENSASVIEKHYRTYALIIDLGGRIDKVCAEESILPISEVTNLIAELIKGNDAPFIFEKVGNRYSHFMIDEFQDTSTVQWNNFLPLLQNAVAQSEESPVLLVGDVKQSIYRWRGGDWTLLGEKAEREFRELEFDPLQENRRSRKEIVEFNNDFIDIYKKLINQKLNSALAEGVEGGYIGEDWAADYHDMVERAYRDHKQEKVSQKSGYVTATLCGYDSYNIEEDPTIRRVIDLQERGYRASDIAILVRTNRESERVADLLLEYKTLHPTSPYTFDVITQTALKVGASDVCQRVIASMKYALSPDDTISEAIIKQRAGYDLSLPLPEAESEFYLRLRSLPLQEAFEEIVLHYGLHTDPTNHAYLQALHEQVIGFSKRRIADLALFVEWWEENGAEEYITMPSGANAITVTTIHKSKGLAFNVVILYNCNWDLTTNAQLSNIIWPKLENNDLSHIPVKYSKEVAASRFAESYYQEKTLCYIENLNTLYVALTRARSELHLLIAPTKSKSIESSSKVGDVVELTLAAMESSGKIGPARLLPRAEQTLLDMEEQRGIAVEAEERCYEYGTPTNPTSEDKEEVQPKEEKPHDDKQLDYSNIGFQTTIPWEKIRIRFPAERYMELGETARLHPLNIGIMLHTIFAEAVTKEDIFRRLEVAAIEGSISADEFALLSERIRTALADPQIAEWFDGHWTSVRNENQILRSTDGGRRPDRVMFSPERTVVVDYKFGRYQNPDHLSQIREYIDLLHQMGFPTAEGYIWYVTLGEVVKA